METGVTVMCDFELYIKHFTAIKMDLSLYA